MSCIVEATLAAELADEFTGAEKDNSEDGSEDEDEDAPSPTGSARKRKLTQDRSPANTRQNIGFELTSYFCFEDGKKVDCLKTYGGKKERWSKKERYEYFGMDVKGGNAAVLEAIASSEFLSRRNSIVTAKRDSLRKRGFKTTQKNMIKLENLVLTMLPDSGFAAMVKGWETFGTKNADGVPDLEERKFRPMLAVEVANLIDFLKSLKTDTQTVKGHVYNGILTYWLLTILILPQRCNRCNCLYIYVNS